VSSKKKSKAAKQAAQAPGGAASSVPEMMVEEPLAQQDWQFSDVEDFESAQVDERELRLLIRDWRRGRATQTFWGMLSDAYVKVFSVLVIGAMFAGGIWRAQTTAAGCVTAGCVAAKTLVPWLLIGAISMLALALATLFGPVVASAAEGFWLLEAPLNRAQILKNRLWSMLAWTFLAAFGFATIIALLVGLPWTDALVWGAATGVVAFAMTALAAAAQGADRKSGVRIAQAIASVVTAAILFLVIAVSVGWLPLPVDAAFNQQAPWLVLGVGGIVSVIAAVLARARLNGIRRARLVSGGDLAAGMQGAAFALDFGLMRDILVERKYLARGQVRPTRGRGVGPSAVIWRDVQRLGRNPVNLLVLAFSAIIPYALTALGVGRLGTPISALILCFVLVPFFDSLRVVSRTKGLSRSFPFEQQQLRSALMTVPGVLMLIWALVTLPAYLIGQEMTAINVNEAFFLSFLTAVAGYLGAIRWVSAKPADYSSPMVATGAGALPPGLLFNLFRGFDVIAVIMFPLVMGWSWGHWASLILAAIIFLVLRSGGLNMDDMAERQEEARRELAEARAQARGGVKPGEKKQVTRSGRPTGSSSYTRR